MNNYTHICIETGKFIGPTTLPDPLIKKGDYCTLLEVKENDPNILGGVSYKLKEDTNLHYAAYLFLPLPPPQVKTVYVSVSETVVKELPEPVLN